jgi:anthranilate phosphoribosyltransferase
VTELNKGKLRTYIVEPKQYGIKKTSIKALRGAGPSYNAKMILSVLKGKKGPLYDAVILNAGFGFVACKKADSVKRGIKLAEESISTKAAFDKLQELKEFTNR